LARALKQTTIKKQPIDAFPNLQNVVPIFWKNEGLTDGFGIVAFKAEVSWITNALPRLVAMAVLAVPVWNAFGTIWSGPTVTTPTSIGHHAEPLKLCMTAFIFALIIILVLLQKNVDCKILF